MEDTMKNTQNILLALLAFILIVPNAFAQNEQKQAAMTELRTQLRAYHIQNIQPKLKVWKEQLDGAMSTADLEKLNEIRAEAEKHRDKMFSMRKEMRDNNRQNNPNCTGDGIRKKDGTCMKDGNGIKGGKGMRKGKDRPEDCNGSRKMDGEFQKDMRLFGEQLKPLAEKYQSTLQNISQQAKPEVELWKTETSKIIDAWKEKYKDQIAEFKGKHSDRAFNQPGRMPKGPNFDFDNKRNTARFMLWNGCDRDPIAEEMLMNDESSITNLRNSPNPFSQTTTIRFEIQKESLVTLTILDAAGNEITKLLNKNLPAGEHSAVFNPSKIGKTLPNGTYFYKLQTNTITETGKMIYTK